MISIDYYRDKSREKQVLHNCKIDNSCPECQIEQDLPARNTSQIRNFLS